MRKRWFLNLQLFADGGDGADGGAQGGENAGENNLSTETEEDEVLASIPERARKYYPKKSVTPSAQEETKTIGNDTPPQEQSKLSYLDLIKSDDYKDAHKEYMEKTISDRLKKYKGIEESNSKMLASLQTVGTKYGLDPTSETFLDDLNKAIDGDDSYYEQYAVEHDISPVEARKIVTMERKIAQADAEKAQAQKDAQMQEQIKLLHENAEKTKQQFPSFDLETEMQDERFRRLCAVTNGDTTSAFMACHWNTIIPNVVTEVSRQAQTQTANAIASNSNRPIENGMSGKSASITQTDFRNMNLAQIRQYAEEQRRKQR